MLDVKEVLKRDIVYELSTTNQEVVDKYAANAEKQHVDGSRL